MEYDKQNLMDRILMNIITLTVRYPQRHAELSGQNGRLSDKIIIQIVNRCLTVVRKYWKGGENEKVNENFIKQILPQDKSLRLDWIILSDEAKIQWLGFIKVLPIR